MINRRVGDENVIVFDCKGAPSDERSSSSVPDENSFLWCAANFKEDC